MADLPGVTSVEIRATDATGAGVGSASENLRKLGAEAASTSARFGPQFTNNIRNVSYQVQDLAVQIGSGTGAMRALSQQLPQMLMGFGAFGAVAGTIIAFLPTIVTLFSDSAKGAKTLEGATSDLNKAIGEVGQTARTFNLDKLYEEFNRSSVAARLATIEQIKFQEAVIKSAQIAAEKKFGETTAGLGEYSTLEKLKGLGGVSGADKLAKDLGIAVDAARALLPALKGLRDGSTDVGLAFTQFGNVLLTGNERAVALAIGLRDIAKTQKDAQGASSALYAALTKMGDGTKTIEVGVGKAEKAILKLGAAMKQIKEADAPKWRELADIGPEVIEAIDKQTAAIDKQARTLGMTSKELIEYQIQQLETKKVVGAVGVDIEKFNAAIDNQIDALRRLGAAQDAQEAARSAGEAARAAEAEWRRTAENIQNSLTDALLRGFESGKDFAKNLRDTLWNMFRTLVLRPTIQAILAPVAGGMSSLIPGTANAGGIFGGSMGGGFDLSSLFGSAAGATANSLIAGGVSSIFGPSTFTAALAGDAFLPGALGASGLGAAGFGSAAGAGLAAAMPWALPIAMLAFAFLSSRRRGGPKTGGYAGDIPDLERFFTPSQKDSDLQAMVSAQQDAYRQMLAALGGRGEAGFAFGFDTDPEGTANDRIRAAVSANGQLLYDTGNIELGRDEAQTQAALELEAKRALLAALQASDLPQDIADLLNQVTAQTADAEAIDNILGVSQALGSIYELFNSDVLEDGMEALEDSLLGVNSAVSRGVDSVRDLIAEYDGTAESATALAQATSGVYQAAVQAVAQMEAMRRAIGSMFENAATEYRLAGMDQAGQRDYLQQQIARDTELLRTATDANEIQRLANLINQNQGRLWGTLTDEERRASAESFAQAAEAAAALADTQIRSATDAMRTLVEDMLTEVRAVFVEAGTRQVDAANTQLVAANTPITINLRGVPSEVGP